MNIEQLKGILTSCSRRKIGKALKALGYRNMAKDPIYGELSLVDIYHGQQTVCDTQRKGYYEYDASIYTQVKGAEGFEIVEIAKNKVWLNADTILPYRIDFYIKEVKNNDSSGEIQQGN